MGTLTTPIGFTAGIALDSPVFWFVAGFITALVCLLAWLGLRTTSRRLRQLFANTFRMIGRSRTPVDCTSDSSRHSQRMESLGRLAGGVAHDFNNALTVIRGFTDLMRPGLAGNQEALGMLGRIEKASDQGISLARQLLAFSRKQLLQPRVIDLNALVGDVEQMMRPLIAEDIKLAIELHGEALAAKVDPVQLEQVMINLTVNARDAMPQGGELTISTAPLILKSPKRATHGDLIPIGSYSELTVSDTGCGMDEAVLSRLFEPFFTTKGKGKGTGLGLATAYGIIQQSGGFIEVESQIDQGTTFRILLPLVPDHLELIVPSQAGEDLPCGVEKILLVEDDADIRDFARIALKRAGYTVIEAENGVEALARCKQVKGEFDLVVTDVVMPILGGVELADCLNERYPKLHVLFMSGHNDSALVRHGVDDIDLIHLNKPFTAAELTKSVRTTLDHVVACCN